MASMEEESKRADEQVAKLEAELRKMARTKGTTGLVRKVIGGLADIEEDSRLEIQQKQDRLENLQSILQKATEEEAKARANLEKQD